MYLWEYIEKEYFFFLIWGLICLNCQFSASPKWNEGQDEQNEILEARYCLRRKISCRIHSLEERRRGCQRLLVKKWRKKKSFCYFTHNNVLNYCIVRSECVLGRTVCFRFVSSIGAMDLVWHVCVVRCWCIAFILVIYM